MVAPLSTLRCVCQGTLSHRPPQPSRAARHRIRQPPNVRKAPGALRAMCARLSGTRETLSLVPLPRPCYALLEGQAIARPFLRTWDFVPLYSRALDGSQAERRVLGRTQQVPSRLWPCRPRCFPSGPWGNTPGVQSKRRHGQRRYGGSVNVLIPCSGTCRGVCWDSLSAEAVIP